MALYPGKLAYAGIALQGAGTTPVTPRKYIPVKDVNFDTQPMQDYMTEYRNKMESTRAPIRSGAESSGSLSAYAYPDVLMWSLWGAMGTVTTTTPAGAANVGIHAIYVNPNDVPNWTITQGLSTIPMFQYGDAKVKTCKLSLKSGEPLTIDSDYVSKGVQRYNNITPTYATPQQPAFTFGNGTVYFDGSASTLAQEIDITLERETEAIRTMTGSLDPTYIYPQDFKASGNIKLFFDSETEYNRFLGTPTTGTPVMQSSATPLALKITFISTAITATLYNACTLEFPEVYYDKVDFKRATDGYVGIGFDFTAAYNDTLQYSMKATVQNSVTSVTP